MTTTKRFIDPSTLRIRPKPFTESMLDDIDGGQEGLLPASTQGKSLRVEFAPWDNSDPRPDGPESVELFWNGEPVYIKEWTAPIAPDDHFIDVPASWLTAGRHEVDYLLKLHTGQPERSDVRILTVDYDPPELYPADSELVFETATITIDYLFQTGDTVPSRVPGYTEPAPGDVVIATWKNPATGEFDQLRTDPLTELNYTYPVRLTFSGDFVRAMDDGPREVTYRVQDRAGNISTESAPAKLLVAAIRAERFAPLPWVVEISGDPAGSGALNPEKAENGATVRIPEEAVYYSDDRVEVQFGEPGKTGSVRVPVGPQTRDVPIPKQHIAAYFKKTLPVFYVIHLPDGSTKESDHFTLSISEYPSSFFSAPQLAAPHSDPVYKKDIPTTGLPIHQRRWPFISMGCQITVTATGTDIDGGQKTETFLNNHQVTETEATAGVSATISQDFMLRLQDNLRFTVRAQVSFDNGESWFPFPELRPMLKL